MRANKEVPNKTTLFSLAGQRYKETGSASDRQRAMAVAGLTHDTVRIVEETLARSGRKSIVRLLKETGLSTNSCR
jgi:hypothetical protein